MALRYANYRLLWIGLLVSFSGSMMQNAAILWHVSLLVPDNQKGLALGLVGLVRVFPIIIFSLIGGVVADAGRSAQADADSPKSPRRSSAAVLGAADLPRADGVWPLYALTAALGRRPGPSTTAGAQRARPEPGAARASAQRHQPEHDHVPDRLGGRTGAGRADDRHVGVGWVYASTRLVRGRHRRAAADARRAGAPAATKPDRERCVAHAALEGLRFVFSAPLIRSTMLLDFFATFFSSATALLPIFAQDILQVGAQGYGWLFAAPAVGALVASVSWCRRPSGSSGAARCCCGRWPSYGWPRWSSACRASSG